MPLSNGTESVTAVGIVGGLVAIWSKFRFVSKSDFEKHRLECAGKIEIKLNAIIHAQEKMNDRMDTFTLHQGAVEQFMKMKE